MKILVPTDFSHLSKIAIDYAIQLSFKFKAELVLLSVVYIEGPGRGSLQAKDLEEVLITDARNECIQLVEEYKAKYNSIINYEVIFGYPVDKIIKNHAINNGVDLIVMGTKGKTGSRNVSFGSTATYVMEKVRNCPVIVVPEAAKIELPKEIVFPTSYKTHYKRRELNHLVDIAKKSDSNIAILHVSEQTELSNEQEEQKKLLTEIFSGIKYSFHFLNYYSVESALNIFVESRESDMVAFINKKHAFFGSILTNPLVKGIAFYSKVPILVMHDLRN